MDFFGFKKRRKKRHEIIMNMISNESLEFLKTGYDALEMESKLGTSNEYSAIERSAIYDELSKRGHIDELGFII